MGSWSLRQISYSEGQQKFSRSLNLVQLICISFQNYGGRKIYYVEMYQLSAGFTYPYEYLSFELLFLFLGLLKI